MKKFLVILLAPIYLATTSGVAVYMHYCMGKVDSVNLFKSDRCTKCGMKTTKNCCTDELKVIKLKDSHQAKSDKLTLASPFTVLNSTYKSLPDPAYPDMRANQTVHNNSPPLSGYDRCIINNIFRI